MNLQFDCLDELKEFLAFSGYTKKTTGEITVDLRVSDKQLSGIVELAAEQISGNIERFAAEAQDVPTSPLVTGQAGGEPTDATHAEGKRKRRTKAEIAADEAAKQATPVTFDKPTDPLDNLKTDPGTPEAAAVAAAVPATEPPSDIEHLRLCREFIGVQGMAKYEQSFALAGIEGKNIMAFTDADRAKHVAALDKLAAG